MKGRQRWTAFAIGAVTAALIVGCGGGNSPDQPASNTSASAQAKTATTGDRGGSAQPSAKKDRRAHEPDGNANGGLQRCVKEAAGNPKAKYACLPPGSTPAEKASDAGGQPSSYSDPQLAQCVKDAGENAKAKDACLPPEPQAPEPSAHDKALEQCAAAADTPKEKNACLKN